MNEQELLLDCLRRLNQGGVRYMLTGSMASNAWGIPRTTHDLDFVLQLPPSQDVLLHKLLWNRMTPSDRQTGDVAGIVAVQGDRLDHAYLRRWANELGLSDDLEKALSGGFRPKST